MALKHWFRPRRFGQVSPGLFRSGQLHPRLVEGVLRRNRIDLVIDLASGDPPDGAAEAAERKAVVRLGIERMEFHLYGDGTARPGVYLGVLQALARARRAERRVLVHCNAGRERTGAIIALYRMLFEGWDGRRAYDEYLQHRARSEPRDALVVALKKHLSGLAAALVESGDLERLPDPMPVFEDAPPR